VDPSDDDALLEQARPKMTGLAVILGIGEPAFARYFRDEVLRRTALLGMTRVDALMLHVDDPADIKSGGLLQAMHELQGEDRVLDLGLAHRDPRAVEWMAQHAAVRLLGVSYALADQAARYRALPRAAEYGMSAIALNCPGDDAAIGFALAERGRVLPVMDRPIPEGLTPMPTDEAERAWAAYQKACPPPPPLERGLPPVVDA
jgi:hypothetical protein